MRSLRMSPLLAGAAAVLFAMAGCSDVTEPLGPQAPSFDLAQSSSGGEFCWYLGSAPLDANRHVVTSAGELDERFGEELPVGFFPEGSPLVTHVVHLYAEGDAYDPDKRIGNGYMVSAVEQEGRNKYSLYHQVVLQPWVGWPHNPADLCTETKSVHVCTSYDDAGSCITSEYRDACVGSFRGLSSETCSKLPCTTRGGLSFVAGSETGFIQSVSGNVNNSNGVLDLYGSDPVVYAWPHGKLCVKYGSEPDTPPEEPEPEPKCTPGMVQRGLC
jgi:hypothetical protein